MKNKNIKIVLVGAGAIGASFIYSAINQGLANEYGLIDLNQELAKGQAMDLEDALPVVPFGANKVYSCDFKDIDDADILVITAGRAQKDGETRLQMIEDNTKIMASIANKVKETKFNGITIIASNPVDILTLVYQKITNYSIKKVISSSCSLDTSRLKVELSKIFDVSPKVINAFVLGEHGDSSIATFSNATLDGVTITNQMYEKYGLNEQKREELHYKVSHKAYEIIHMKKATYYGIGAVLVDICRSILRNEKRIISLGTMLSGEYGVSGVYASIPCLLGSEGIIKTFEFPLSSKEKEKFISSIEVLKENSKKALEVIK